MHTTMVMAGGFFVLGLCLLLGRFFGGPSYTSMAVAALYFIPLWLAGAGINLWVGVSKAGYSVVEEFPIFLVIFAIPAAVALALWWMWSHA